MPQSAGQDAGCFCSVAWLNTRMYTFLVVRTRKLQHRVLISRPFSIPTETGMEFRLLVWICPVLGTWVAACAHRDLLIANLRTGLQPQTGSHLHMYSPGPKLSKPKDTIKLTATVLETLFCEALSMWLWIPPHMLARLLLVRLNYVLPCAQKSKLMLTFHKLPFLV